jgi:hypothetical protein
MSKNDDELIEFIGEVTDGAYILVSWGAVQNYKFWITRDESSSAIVSSAGGKRTERFSEKLFVTLVTEVSLISRESNLRFERISISREFL